MASALTSCALTNAFCKSLLDACTRNPEIQSPKPQTRNLKPYCNPQPCCKQSRVSPCPGHVAAFPAESLRELPLHARPCLRVATGGKTMGISELLVSRVGGFIRVTHYLGYKYPTSVYIFVGSLSFRSSTLRRGFRAPFRLELQGGWRDSELSGPRCFDRLSIAAGKQWARAMASRAST